MTLAASSSLKCVPIMPPPLQLPTRAFNSQPITQREHKQENWDNTRPEGKNKGRRAQAHLTKRLLLSKYSITLTSHGILISGMDNDRGVISRNKNSALQVSQTAYQLISVTIFCSPSIRSRPTNAGRKSRKHHVTRLCCTIQSHWNNFPIQSDVINIL